jgi:hypothetical protein
MGRVTELKFAQLFENAFDNLPGTSKARLVDGLSVDSVEDGTAAIPYYLPAIFLNTLCRFEDETDDQRIAAIAAVLRFLSRVFADTEPKPEAFEGLIVECNLEFALDIVKSEDFRKNPAVLESLKIPSGAYSIPRSRWI